jgi:hypothetical protein
VDVVYLEKSNWKYEGSTASNEGGGRTHTFGVRSPSKLIKQANAIAYMLPGIKLKRGRPILMEEMVSDSAPPNKMGKKMT